MLKRVYLFIMFCLFAATYRHFSGMFSYVKELLPGLLQGLKVNTSSA
jgi:hypothetical protein